MVLFRCDSVYQLVNAVQIKISLLREEAADLILSDHTDFSDIAERLAAQKIFRRVYRLASREDARAYWELSEDQRRKISLEPETFADISYLEEDYTDFYLSFDTAYAKLMYYAMIRRGMDVAVHLFEDGMATYICDVEKRCEEDGMDHRSYGQASFLNSISELLLYEPDLFTGPRLPFFICPIPKIDAGSEQICRLFSSVFGTAVLPEQKYIFLEEAFVDDNIPCNDLELCLCLEEIVGKENLIVKLHPRNRTDRFTPYGFQVMKQSNVPWEMVLLTGDISKKILFTVSSNASITSKLIFQKKMNAVLLYRMFMGKTWLMANRNFEASHKKAVAKFNEKRKCVYTPHSMDEVKETLKYIGGLERIERTEAVL
ncbi:polysialyltransferase family glycosyltransferase [Anaerostipes sp.]|uniref:polysialyltransferase family glycosyltransferase n=1 Tax=Anaerostipes sp. TaxID=1872530 RepID=UPI0025BEBD65|nr:polysialyltransferase family glycosyltransferase [Anaerostipes sp.]MBS7007257.1 hypothetical protein [Anaerostipes sp.]